VASRAIGLAGLIGTGATRTFPESWAHCIAWNLHSSINNALFNIPVKEHGTCAVMPYLVKCAELKCKASAKLDTAVRYRTSASRRIFY
jgi:hypothetical protein